jgi:hypothetical protein
MSNLEKFIDEWFPQTQEWQNIGIFILESGIELTGEENPKWLTGYTNIGKSSKPHHTDKDVRYMEEQWFMLHDVVHQIFTLETQCSEEEYVKRQIYGELFTFYLVEYIITNYHYESKTNYFDKRGTHLLIHEVLSTKPKHKNIIDYMFNTFINYEISFDLNFKLNNYGLKPIFNKYSKMFQEDLYNSRKNYTFVPNIPSYCMVGASSQNHIDFFSAVSQGAIKNIKRDFNLVLPNNWI